MDPIEKFDGEQQPSVNRVSVDNQTDINSSAYAEGVQSDIAKGDEKLGKEINDLDSSVKESLNGIESGIADNTKAIEDAAKAGEEAREAILDTVVFNAGDESASLTSERMRELITEFKAEMADNIETVRDENSSEKEIRIATFWLNQFGEVYTPLGFNLWQLKDFSSVEDDLDSATMEEYEEVIEELRSSILKIKTTIAELDAKPELTPEEKDMRAVAQKELKSIEGNFIRWTDPNDATPDVVEDRVTTLEKGLQWRFDSDDNAMDAFKEDLMRNVIGVSGAGEYYKEMTDRFKAEAENAAETIKDYNSRDEAGEEHSQEDELEKAKADYFVSKFGTIASVVAIKSFEDYNDSYNSVQWDEETYNEYLSSVSDSVSVKAKLETELAEEEASDEPNEDKISKLKEDIKTVGETLRSITCESGLNPYLECLDGYVNWYVARHDSEFEAFQDNLSRNVLGTTSAGEYYKEMTDRFKAEAENAAQTIKEYDVKEGAGEEITPEDELAKAKAEFFVNAFGTIASIVAVKAYEDYRDGFNAVQWDEETYQRYVEEVNAITAALAQEEAQPIEEQKLDLIKELKSKIGNYTCDNGVDGDVVCLDGYVSWYVYTHDTEFKQYIDAATEENGFNPSVQVDYLENKKSDFKAEMEDALMAIDETPDGEEAPADAMDFVSRFGKISNSQTAFHNWLAYKAEGRVSDLAGEMFRVIECVTNNLKDSVNDIVTTSTEVASYYPLPDGKVSEFTLFGVPADYSVTQVFINGIASTYSSVEGEDKIRFFVPPHAGSNLTILLEVKSTQNISSLSIDGACGIVLPSEIRGYDSYECDTLTRNAEAAGARASAANEALAEAKDSKSGAEETQIDLAELNKIFNDDKSDTELAIAEDKNKKEIADAELTKLEDNAGNIEDNLSDVTSTLSEKQSKLADLATKKDANEVQLQIANIAREVEAGRPFPSEDKLAELDAQIDSLKKDIDDAKDKQETLKAECDKLDTDKADLTKELSDVNSSIAKSQSEIDALEDSIVKNSISVKLIMSNIILVDSKSVTIEDTIKKLEEVITEHESDQAKAKKEEAELKAEMKEKGCNPGKEA